MKIVVKILVAIILIMVSRDMFADVIVDTNSESYYRTTLNSIIQRYVKTEENLVVRHEQKKTYPVEVGGGKLMLNRVPKYGNRILITAKSMLGNSSSDISGTRGGRLACAAMVSEVLKEAKVAGPITLSTYDMYVKLRKCSNWKMVSVNEMSPGDIIISPSEGDNHGHVGIVGDKGKIYSNDSREGVFRINYNVSKWVKYYGDRKGLDVYVFRCIKA